MEIQHAVLVRASREAVFDALTTPEGLDGWFTSGAEIDLRPGGFIRFRWVDWGPDRINDEDRGPILEVQRPEKFTFQWHPFSADDPTTVRFSFTPSEEGTILRVVESGYQDTPEGRAAFADCAAGWGEALTLLKFYVEHGLRY